MTVTARPELSTDELQALDGYWRAANYLSVARLPRVTPTSRRPGPG